MRIVSLVPSVTEAVAAMGAADSLVGVTDWCWVGAPDSAARVGGTKNPSIGKILALRPDLVIVNEEENRLEDVERLRAAGLPVHVTYPRRVADVPPMLRELGRVLGREPEAERCAAPIEQVLAEPPAGEPLRALTLIWRKPWMAVGPGTYADDLLGFCGFRNVITDGPRYPQLERFGPYTGQTVQVGVVLLPTEPYEFGEQDLPAVRELVGPGPALEIVDGQLLTWHGVRTAAALDHFRGLRAGLGSALGS